MSIIFGVAFSKMTACIALCTFAAICAVYAVVQFTSFGDDVPRWGDE